MQVLDIDKIRENDFINRFDWYSLNCLERTKCIISECMMENSVYIFLLFMGIGGWYLNDGNRQGFEKFIEEQTQIKFELLFRKKDHFYEDLKGFIRNGDGVVLISDNMYREGSDAFKSHHHEHFLILKGYDPDSDQFIIVDEDMSKEYHKPANCTEGVIYCIQSIQAAYLKELCCFDYRDIWLVKDTDPSMYACLRAVKKPGSPDVLCLSKIIEMYREHISQMITRLPDYIRQFKECIAQTKEQHDDIYANHFMNYPEYFKAWIVFPGKSEIISRHFFCLYTQRRFFDLKMEKSEVKTTLMNAFNETISGYFRIRNVILKCLMADDKNGYDRLVGYFDDIFTQEQSLYHLILQHADKAFRTGKNAKEECLEK